MERVIVNIIASGFIVIAGAFMYYVLNKERDD